jgi:DNA-binding NarL/FixJ family response regulator
VRHGFEVTVACRASDLLALDQHFQFGIFDIDLPEQNGVDLARLCLARGAVARVVFYSAAKDERLRREAQSLGEFVEKRAGVDILVERLVRRKRGTSSVPLSAHG